MQNKIHKFSFNVNSNGGEQLVLTTTFGLIDDKNSIYNQELCLMSYGNSASFTLGNALLTPVLLRKLADELEALYV